MNIWHDISPHRIHQDDFIAVIEIPEGSKAKYEMDKETACCGWTGCCTPPPTTPANYGFIPRTYANDGDPLDVLVLCSERIYPMSLVRCYPIGVIIMEDGGSRDEKIIAIPFDDPHLQTATGTSPALPQHIFAEMEHFFTVYKRAGERQGHQHHRRGGPHRGGTGHRRLPGAVQERLRRQEGPQVRKITKSPTCAGIQLPRFFVPWASFPGNGP